MTTPTLMRNARSLGAGGTKLFNAEDAEEAKDAEEGKKSTRFPSLRSGSLGMTIL
jgi:hypothetical protein